MLLSVPRPTVILFATKLDQNPTSFFQIAKVHYDLKLRSTLFDSIITTPTPTPDTESQHSLDNKIKN